MTNAKNDGDRSAAVYRAPGKQGSSSGNYWVTTTIASDSFLQEDIRGISVRRYDAPLPASTAAIVNELWLAILERSRPDKTAIPCSPTGIFSATSARGIRLKAVTVSVRGEDSFCWALMVLGQDMINYPQFSAAKRVEAARKIEKEANRLLKRMARR